MLRFFQFSPGIRNGEKIDTIDLRKYLNSSRAWRPFQMERIARVQTAFLPVAGESPGMNDLPALLLNRTERREFTGRDKADLFFKFANRSRE